jgi:hypothetical protein
MRISDCGLNLPPADFCPLPFRFIRHLSAFILALLGLADAEGTRMGSKRQHLYA